MFKLFPPTREGVETMGKNYSMTFFGKVMSFFALAIACSLLGTFVAYNYMMEFFMRTPNAIMVLFIIELAIIFTSRKWQNIPVVNKIMFGSFTFITGITIAPVIMSVAASYGGVMIIMKALLATTLTFVAAAVLGWTTKMNLSGMRGFLMMGLIGLIITGILSIFFPLGGRAEMIYSGFGVLLFSGFVMYDIQRLKVYPENMYIEAALQLYLDMFNLFLFILRLMSANRR